MKELRLHCFISSFFITSIVNLYQSVMFNVHVLYNHIVDYRAVGYRLITLLYAHCYPTSCRPTLQHTPTNTTESQINYRASYVLLL